MFEEFDVNENKARRALRAAFCPVADGAARSAAQELTYDEFQMFALAAIDNQRRLEAAAAKKSPIDGNAESTGVGCAIS
jgi:hypothetical protein